MLSTELPPYRYDLIFPLQRSHSNPGCLQAFQCRKELFQNSFLLCFVNNWNMSNSSIRYAESHSLFRKIAIGIY